MTVMSAWTALRKSVSEVLLVLASPSIGFSRYSEQPSLLPAYTVNMMVSLIVSLIVLPTTLNLLHISQGGSSSAGVPPFMLRGAAIGGSILSSLALPWIHGFFIGLTAMFFGQFVGGGVKLWQYMGMVGLARIPASLGSMVQATLLTRASSLEEMTSVTLSMAALADSSHPWVKAVLMSLNPFELWYLMLVAVGFSALHRLSAKGGLPLSLSLYVWGVLTSGWALGD